MMVKLHNSILVIITTLFLMTLLAGCNSKNNTKSTYSIKQFENAMKDKGYTFEIKDVKQDFLPTTRKRMIIDKEAIDIYIFSNDKSMEDEANHIVDGGNYNDGYKSVKVSWGSFPHFYKKGSLIVQYIGEDEKIISDLKDILGEQFAGYIP